MHAQLCPKCNGQGIVSKPPWVPGDSNQWVSDQTSHTCNLCNGAMVLYVQDDPPLPIFEIPDPNKTGGA